MYPQRRMTEQGDPGCHASLGIRIVRWFVSVWLFVCLFVIRILIYVCNIKILILTLKKFFLISIFTLQSSVVMLSWVHSPACDWCLCKSVSRSSSTVVCTNYIWLSSAGMDTKEDVWVRMQDNHDGLKNISLYGFMRATSSKASFLAAPPPTQLSGAVDVELRL
jgi:hypothetical protein